IYDSRQVNDLPHFDLRWPVLYGATLLSLLALLLGRRWRGDRRSTAVLWAFLGTYLLLLARFTRYRYGLGIEVVAPLLCVLVLDGFWQLSRFLAVPRLVLAALGSLHACSVGRRHRGRVAALLRAGPGWLLAVHPFWCCAVGRPSGRRAGHYTTSRLGARPLQGHSLSAFQ